MIARRGNISFRHLVKAIAYSFGGGYFLKVSTSLSRLPGDEPWVPTMNNLWTVAIGFAVQ